MMPPLNTPISQLIKETGISEATLYTWRKQARKQGLAVPGDGKNPEDWSSEDKFAVVLETATLNKAELAEYCRKKGLYVEQIAAWRNCCVVGSQKKGRCDLGGRSGRLISLADRQKAIHLIEVATTSGARKFRACEELGITVRTYQRWTENGEVQGDGRLHAKRRKSANRYSW